MPGLVQTILRNATRDNEGPLNILSFPTHERYQTNLSKTGHFFYLWQGDGIKPWVHSYGEVPPNTILLNSSDKEHQMPENIDIDIILSQNKFGQFNIARQISEQIGVPLISLEHTLPMEQWSDLELQQLYHTRGDINIFISEYSRERWGWPEDEAVVVHHGVDSELFSVCKDVERENRVLSVVNDWIDRDWCCGYKLWEQVTGYPDSKLSLHVVGDTPGLSSPAPSTEALVEQYRKSRIFLNTSLISPVPTALLEAMSCGCAVVTTATCMIPEIIDNGKNGYMSNNPEELRSFVDKLIQDESLAEEIGNNARQTILKNFSINSFVENWNNLFYSCVR